MDVAHGAQHAIEAVDRRARCAHHAPLEEQITAARDGHAARVLGGDGTSKMASGSSSRP